LNPWNAITALVIQMDSTSETRRGLPDIWGFLSQNRERLALANVWGQFSNPDPQHPVDAGSFLARVDLRDLPARVWQRYRKPQQVQWDPEGMLRAVLYFGLKGYKHLTQAWRDLKQRDGLAEALGLGAVPPYKTLWHFVMRRPGLGGVHELFSRLVELVVSEGRGRGLPIGEVVAVDAMPIETARRDRRAEFSQYYKVRGYKAHNVVDPMYGIPLDVKVTRMNHGESPELPDAVRRVRARGCPVDEVMADGGYDSAANFGVVCQELKAQFWTRFASNSVIDPSGEAEHIWEMYERSWRDEGYVPGAPLEQRLEFLYQRCRQKEVGQYHRNEMFRMLLSDTERYRREYNRRILMEGGHGYWKQHRQLTKVESRPMRFVDLRYTIFHMGTLVVALTRLQNGVRSGLCLTVGIQ
jgi:hypothetical protein